MSTWLINSSTPESLGLRIVGGEFRSGSASTVRLEAAANFDASGAFIHGDAVTIYRDSAVFFVGTVREIPRIGTDADERQTFLVEDAWALLERTTYQESWATGGSPVLLPQVVLGMDHAGNRIDTGEQITEVVNFAHTSGIAIQAGTYPVGLDLWPSEAVGISCAEVIRTCLRFHPDWMAWIDPSTSPHPTLQVTPRSSAIVGSLNITQCSGITVNECADRVPDCVRIVYTCASTIDDTVYRDGAIDKYPTAGPDSGPGVLTTVIELAGGQAAVAKQQIETLDVPVFDGTAEENQAEAKAWLKAVYPWLVYVAEVPASAGPPVVEYQAAKGIQDTSFAITKYGKALITDDNPKPTPINPNATYLELRDTDDAPRMLINGTIQEWMRKRSGKVAVQMLCAETQTATQAEIDLLRQLPPWFEFLGTNAETKIYKGQPQWRTIAESVPSGIAEAYYNTIAGGCMYEGSATLIDDSTVGAMSWSGRCLNLSGSAQSAWADMKAPIHAISWDAATERCTLSFGPNADYSPQDFIEYLRLLRARPVTWWTQAERASGELGCETAPSAKGDALAGGIVPAKHPQPPPPTPWPPFKVLIVNTGTIAAPEYKAVVQHGRVFERQRATEAANMLYHEPDNLVTAAAGDDPEYHTRFTATATQAIYVQVTESIPAGVITAVTIITGLANLQASEPYGTYATFNYKLAEFEELPDGSIGVIPFLAGSHIYHWPEGKGLNLIIEKWALNASGDPEHVPGYDVTHYWRKGGYVGIVNPGTTPDQIQYIHSIS